MSDIDVDQWRNAQALLLTSAKAARRLVVIHEDGEVVKFRHTAGVECAGRVEKVDDAPALARELYEKNQDEVDFVVVMERHAVDSYFAAVQDSWAIDDDLDTFVQRTYALLDEFEDGIVTHPGPARKVLGLQWRTGASLQEAEAAAKTLVAAGGTVILGVHDGSSLWASLILDLDADQKITSITTADPAAVDISGSPEEVLDRLTSWQQSSGKSVALGLLLDRAVAEEYLAAPSGDKGRVLASLVAAGTAHHRA
ncbi:MAG TPA: hypothetical protein VD864_00365 [Nocardioides sp.]|nr:hypothetical protein [Nocardioides sp.]